MEEEEEEALRCLVIFIKKLIKHLFLLLTLITVSLDSWSPAHVPRLVSF